MRIESLARSTFDLLGIVKQIDDAGGQSTQQVLVVRAARRIELSVPLLPDPRYAKARGDSFGAIAMRVPVE
jgi:hypothetical protein